MKKPKKPLIISITGTKGKTSIARLFEHILLKEKFKDVLLVDSDGHKLNGKRKSSFQDSLFLKQAAPTVCPGKYLYELRGKENSIAILETSIGSAGTMGLGFAKNNIGLFHNVYTDHLGVRVKTKDKLASDKAKIVFSRLSILEDSNACFNANDLFVCKNLNKIPEKSNAMLIPYFFSDKKIHFDIVGHIKSGKVAIELQNKKIYIHKNNKKHLIVNLAEIDWIFNGEHEALAGVVLATVSLLFAFTKSVNKVKKYAKHIASFKTKKEDGRAYLIDNDKYQIFVDYAHEIESLKVASDFARKRSKNKTIALVRFAVDRIDRQLQDYGRKLYGLFDTVVVYDKIDGKYKKPSTGVSSAKPRFAREVGEISKIVHDALMGKIKKYKKPKTKAVRIVREDKAIEYISKIANKGDFILIVPNDFKRTNNWIEKYFKL